MTDYISREAALKACCDGCNAMYEDEPCEPSECVIRIALKSLPAADVREVKRGKWENAEPNFMAKCSNCRRYYISRDEKYDFHFCPNCGSQMVNDDV